jgi:transposase-like protein
MNHCSTVQERVSMVSQMLATPIHGLVSQLSRSHQVSRQTLYRWAATGRQALEEALGQHLVPVKPQEAIVPVVLTLLIETHASYRSIQTCVRDLQGVHLSLGRIVGIIKEAGQRAQGWLSQQQADTPRVLALD